MTLSDISAQQQAQAEKREMERRLQESQNLDSLGVLAAGIAHDFNNLLTGILGNASLLRAEVRRGRMTDSYLAQIEDTALRAAELCRQMLAYAGKGQFERRELVINEVVEETLSLLGPGPLNRHSVQLKLTGNLPMVLGDGAQLRQVLSNLLRNAAESLRPRPGAASASGRSPSRQGRESPSEPRGEKAGSRRTITVVTSLQTLDGDAIRGSYGDSAAPPGAYVAFEVQDTGSGIAPEVQKRMFEPFFSTRPDGRGLGLSTVLGIVRRHGGVLRVRTELDRGSSFTVLLPAVDPARLRQ
jgi:signal transduction histidine kinase